MLYLVYSSTGDSCPHPLSWAKASLLAQLMKNHKPANTYTLSLILDL